MPLYVFISVGIIVLNGVPSQVSTLHLPEITHKTRYAWNHPLVYSKLITPMQGRQQNKRIRREQHIKDFNSLNDLRFNTVPIIQNGYRIQPKQGFFQRNLLGNSQLPQFPMMPNWQTNQNAVISGLQGQLANTGFQERVQYKTIPSSLHSPDFYAGAPSDSIVTNGLHALAGLASSQPLQQFNFVRNHYQPQASQYQSHSLPMVLDVQNYQRKSMNQNFNQELHGFPRHRIINPTLPLQARQVQGRSTYPNNIIQQPALGQMNGVPQLDNNNTPLKSQVLAHIALRNTQILSGNNLNQPILPLKQPGSQEENENLTIGQYDQSRGGGDLTSIHEYLYGEDIVFKRR